MECQVSHKMLAKTKCPNCKETEETDCEACIEGGTLLHNCGEDEEPEVYNVKWKVIEEN